MAYMSQEHKKKIAALLKEALKGTGVKYTLGVQNHSTIVFNMKSAPIDFIANYNETMKGKNTWRGEFDSPAKHDLHVNPYHYKDQFSGKALEIITKIMTCLNEGNWNKSDIQTDYFNVGHYVDLNIGKWDKAFIVTEK